MAITQIGQHKARLESFTWEKPGVASAVYSQITKIGAGGSPPILSNLYGVPMSYQGKSVRNMGSHWETKFFYKGAANPPLSPTDPESEGTAAEKWSMDISLNTCPITQHPNIDKLMSVYKGVLRHGEVEWSPYISGSPNPLYGIREFFYPNVILKVQKVLRSGSANVADLTKLGKIDSPYNSGFGFSYSSSNGRSPWLKIEHTYRAEGDQKVETQAWRYGGINGKGGWLNKIYAGSEKW